MLSVVPYPLRDQLGSRLVLVSHTSLVGCAILGAERLGGTTSRLDVEPRRFIRKHLTCQEGEQANKRTSRQHGHLPASSPIRVAPSLKRLQRELRYCHYAQVRSAKSYCDASTRTRRSPSLS